MCAEAMWWQCHRSLIADDFKCAGWEVIHLLAPGRAQEHPYTSAARIVDGRLSYAASKARPRAGCFEVAAGAAGIAQGRTTVVLRAD